MKFCNRKLYSYNNFNNVLTTLHYVTLEDVINFHGEKFANQWKEFIKNKPTIDINSNKCYFFDDYVFAARQTDSFLNPIG